MAVTAVPAAPPALASLWEGPLCWRLPANLALGLESKVTPP